MKRVQCLARVLVVVGIHALALASSRAAAEQSPESWRQLALPAFVQTIEQVTSATPAPSAAVWKEIRAQSAERLLGVTADATQAEYGDLVSLYLWARPVLTAEQRETVLAGMRTRIDQASGWTFEKMRAVQVRMNLAELPLSQIHAIGMAWLATRDVRTIEDVGRLVWLFALVQMNERQEVGRQEFSVRWTGTIRPPADGVYTLSLCPLDLDFRVGRTFREQRTTIWVADQPILDSGQGGWKSTSQGVTLSADQATPIRIELAFACSSRGVIDARPAIGLLYWESPGLTRQLVPSTALGTPDGSAQGLQGAYQIKTGEHTVRVTRVDQQLDFIWYHQNYVVSPHHALRGQLANQLFAVAGSPSTIAGWESGTVANPGHLQVNWALLESLSASRHGAWCALLAAHPALLTECTDWEALNVYHRCSVGAPDAALGVVGTWAQLHADALPKLAADFLDANREVYRRLARKMVWHYPPHLAAFEQAYLRLPDGRCVLPVAYTLAYGYWVKGRIGDWIDQLDAQLNDPQLTGDRRVNWLIARAQAESLRRCPAGRHWLTIDRALAGRSWLDEACLVARSEPVRLRAYQELAARMMVDQRIAAARSLLDHAATRCTSGPSSTSIAQWRAKLDSLLQTFAARQAQRQTDATNAYRRQLQTRRDRAVQRGNSDAAARYEQLLGQDNP